MRVVTHSNNTMFWPMLKPPLALSLELVHRGNPTGHFGALLIRIIHH